MKAKPPNGDPAASQVTSYYHSYENAKLLQRIRADARELDARGVRIMKIAEKSDELIKHLSDELEVIDLTGALLDEKRALFFVDSLLSEDEAQLLNPTEAAELLGVPSVEAMYQRIYRANRRGEPHPFWKPEGSRSYLAHKVDILEWGKTLTGKKRVRRPRGPCRTAQATR